MPEFDAEMPTLYDEIITPQDALLALQDKKSFTQEQSIFKRFMSSFFAAKRAKLQIKERQYQFLHCHDDPKHPGASKLLSLQKVRLLFNDQREKKNFQVFQQQHVICFQYKGTSYLQLRREALSPEDQSLFKLYNGESEQTLPAKKWNLVDHLSWIHGLAEDYKFLKNSQGQAPSNEQLALPNFLRAKYQTMNDILQIETTQAAIKTWHQCFKYLHTLALQPSNHALQEDLALHLEILEHLKKTHFFQQHEDLALSRADKYVLPLNVEELPVHQQSSLYAIGFGELLNAQYQQHQHEFQKLHDHSAWLE